MNYNDFSNGNYNYSFSSNNEYEIDDNIFDFYREDDNNSTLSSIPGNSIIQFFNKLT
jgi:hypothetical protein